MKVKPLVFRMKVKDIIIGQRYNDIIIVGPKKRENDYTYFGCKCARCGKEYWIQAKHIGSAKTCRECSEKSEIKDLSGKRFGRLVALEYMGRKNDRTLWRCVCDCGRESIVGYTALMTGNTRSCGCLEKENLYSKEFKRSRRKSASKDFDMNIGAHPLYGLWSSMLTRCYNKSHNSYKHYGGRGIKVCDRWLPENKGFENFLKDMGPRPSPKHTIDRIDNDGNYSPENCRWATPRQQGSNKRTSIVLFYKGVRVPALDVCDATGLKYQTLSHQLKKGYDINIIIENKGADFRQGKYKKNLDAIKNGNRNITIFVPGLESNGTELENE